MDAASDASSGLCRGCITCCVHLQLAPTMNHGHAHTFIHGSREIIRVKQKGFIGEICVQRFQLSLSIFFMLDMCCYFLLRDGNQE